MRVLLTTDTVGGVWTFTQELATELLDWGHSVALVSFGGAASRAQSSWCAATVQAYGEAFRYVGSGLPLEWMPHNESAYAGGEELLLRVVEEFEADVVHCSQFCFGRLPVALPKVITAHSDVLSWGRACRSFGFEKSAWLDRYRGLLTEGLAGADAVVAPTGWMLDALVAAFPLQSPGHVIYNGRNLSPPVGVTRRLQAVSVGRLWDEGKNLALLARIDATMPVLVAGAIRCDHAEAPEDLCGVEMLGPLTEDELLHLFCGSSVYLVPSLYEPFGLAPLEAALCGCAIVAMDIASLREVWGNAALYFSNEAELTSVLQMLWNKPAILAEAQEGAGRRARMFTRERMTQGYVALYQNLLESGKAASTREMTYA